MCSQEVARFRFMLLETTLEGVVNSGGNGRRPELCRLQNIHNNKMFPDMEVNLDAPRSPQTPPPRAATRAAQWCGLSSPSWRSPANYQKPAMTTGKDNRRRFRTRVACSKSEGSGPPDSFALPAHHLTGSVVATWQLLFLAARNRHNFTLPENV